MTQLPLYLEHENLQVFDSRNHVQVLLLVSRVPSLLSFIVPSLRGSWFPAVYKSSCAPQSSRCRSLNTSLPSNFLYKEIHFNSFQLEFKILCQPQPNTGTLFELSHLA